MYDQAPPPGSMAQGKSVKARDKVFDWFAAAMHRVGIRPNHLTLGQVPLYVWMIKEGLEGDIVTFGILQLVVIMLDGMDGTLARRMGTASRAGAILDAVFDLAGIVLVVVIAAHLHPRYALWLGLALAANLLLYAQNYRLDEKAVTYIRGPIVLGMYFETLWRGIFWFGIIIPLVVAAIILVVRQFGTPREDTSGGPEPYRPGFSAERRG